MKIIIGIFILLNLSGCASKQKYEIGHPKPFITYGAISKLSPTDFEGLNYFISEDYACKILSDENYNKNLTSRVSNKLDELGFKRTFDRELSHFDLYISCLDQTAYYRSGMLTHSAKNISGSDISETLTTVSNSKVEIVRIFNNNKIGLIRTTNKGKIIQLHSSVLQNKNNFQPQLVLENSIVFADDENLKNNWDQIVVQMVEGLNILKDQVTKKFIIKEICTPRFGFELDYDEISSKKYFIKKVNKGSPAQKVGLRSKDEILTVSALPVGDFYKTIAKDILEGHKEVPIQFRRNGKIYTREIRSANICVKK